MKKGFIIFLGMLLFLGFATMVSAQQQAKMTLATGGTAGTYYPFGRAMADVWNSRVPELNVTVLSTNASAENVRLVSKGEADLAFAQSDTLDFACNAKESFEEKLTSLRAIAALYPEVVQVVVRDDIPAKDFGELKDARIGIGSPGSGTEANFRQLMDVHKMKKEDVHARHLSFSESAEQFRDGHIDAFIVTAGIPNTAIMDVAKRRDLRILPILADKAAQLAKRYPFLSPVRIPADTYKNQSSEVTSVAVTAVLIASESMTDDVAYKLTRTLFENQDELATSHAKGKELNIKTAVSGVSIPFHPGAVKFYREKGVIR